MATYIHQVTSYGYVDGGLPVILTGHVPAVTVPWDDLGPTSAPLSVPPAMIVYVTSHSSPLTVTIANPLVIGATPMYVHKM